VDRWGNKGAAGKKKKKNKKPREPWPRDRLTAHKGIRPAKGKRVREKVSRERMGEMPRKGGGADRRKKTVLSVDSKPKHKGRR